MRVHLVWGPGWPQLGLETAAAARYCRMTILQNVSVVKSRGVSATSSGEVNHWGGASFRPHVPNAARVVENWFFMVALIPWPGLANWLAGGNAKIEKKWEGQNITIDRNLTEQRSK